jgi:hypothetical protein
MTRPIAWLCASLIVAILLFRMGYTVGYSESQLESTKAFKKVLKKMTVVENKCVNVPGYDCYRIKDFN